MVGGDENRFGVRVRVGEVKVEKYYKVVTNKVTTFRIPWVEVMNFSCVQENKSQGVLTTKFNQANLIIEILGSNTYLVFTLE